MSIKKKTKKPRQHLGLGGARPGAGRKKIDRRDYAQITCILRQDTVEKLQAIQPQYGEVLQWHLDQHPLPTREEYLFLRQGKQFTLKFRRNRRRYPVIVTQAKIAPLRPPKRRDNDEAFEKVLAADKRAKRGTPQLK